MGEKSKADKEFEFAKIRVKKGAVVINDWDDAFYTHKHDDIVVICINCSTKYFSAYNNNDSENKPYLVIPSVYDSRHLNPEVDRDDDTEVYFEDHLDWQIKFISTSKSLVEVCLIKRDDQ